MPKLYVFGPIFVAVAVVGWSMWHSRKPRIVLEVPVPSEPHVATKEEIQVLAHLVWTYAVARFWIVDEQLERRIWLQSERYLQRWPRHELLVLQAATVFLILHYPEVTPVRFSRSNRP